MSHVMTPADYTALPLVPGDHRIAYDERPDQFGELYLPEEGPGPYPLVILLHGGCWRARFGLMPLGQLARRLTELQVIVWNVEYRRLDGGGGWPTTFLDTAAAADYARQLATEYPLDISRVVAVGHSAGGHLAAWLAQRHNLEPGMTLFQKDPLPITGVVSLAGIPDLVKAGEFEICSGAPEELIGGDHDTYPERYRQASPHSGPALGVTQWHIVGADDSLVPARYVSNAIEFAKGRGEDVTLITVPDAGHFELVSAGSHAWPIVESTILSALC